MINITQTPFELTRMIFEGSNLSHNLIFNEQRGLKPRNNSHYGTKNLSAVFLPSASQIPSVRSWLKLTLFMQTVNRYFSDFRLQPVLL